MTGFLEIRRAPSQIIFSVFVLVSPTLASAQDVIGKAQELTQRGKISEAIELLEKASQETTENREKARFLSEQGWLYYQAGKSNLAESSYNEALELVREEEDHRLMSQIKNGLGLQSYVDGDLENAERYFQESVALSGDSDDNPAKKYLDLVERQKISAKVVQHIRNGIKERLVGEFEKAIEQYNKALEIDENNAGALEYLGYAQYRLGKLSEAETSLKKAKDIDPTRRNINVNLMKVYCKSNKEQKFREIAHDTDQLEKIISDDEELGSECKDYISLIPNGKSG